MSQPVAGVLRTSLRLRASARDFSREPAKPGETKMILENHIRGRRRVLDDAKKARLCELIDQESNLKACIYWGHAPNSQTRGLEMKTAMEKLDLMVIIDPYPTASAAMPDRQDGVYLLPAATQFECAGSATASNRSIQWREKVIEPLFESKPDHTIMYLLAKKFGFGDQLLGKANGKQNIALQGDEPVVEDILREINAGTWTIGYTGQSPERLKSHMANQKDFDMLTQKATTGPNKGDYYGLPWPCWGTPEFKHPGTPLLYNTNLSVKEGGGTFRARFGVERMTNPFLT